ncbi:hypothetical protein K438DRAFT_488684 [Mycena galopus ATCC 62051]|nr:hypothetical protein K438DRAFT_488684 [Mycena galopus ATCC 62051]
MPGITILPANLATLVVESFLTLAGTNHPTKHHFTSVVFLGVTALFIVVTIHWSFVIYQAFFAFLHFGTNATEDAFYADLAQKPEVIKSVLLCIAVLLGDALVTYRLWIIWGQSGRIIIFPILALLGVAISAIGVILEITKWQPEVRGKAFINEEKPWTGTAFMLSLLANLFSTSFIVYRIWKVTKVKSASESRLTWFVSILAESAALQTLWLIFTAMTLFSSSDLDFIATDNFPVILGISNTLIHARVGLGWSQGSGVEHKPHSPAKYASDAV